MDDNLCTICGCGSIYQDRIGARKECVTPLCSGNMLRFHVPEIRIKYVCEHCERSFESGRLLPVLYCDECGHDAHCSNAPDGIFIKIRSIVRFLNRELSPEERMELDRLMDKVAGDLYSLRKI